MTLGAGGNLQAAINNATLGQTICLQAGAVFTGNYTLPAKSGAGWIVFRSTAADLLPPAGSRVAPADAANMPRIISPNDLPAIQTATAAHNYRFVGIEITTAWTSETQTAFSVVTLWNQETVLTDIPSYFIFDRCFVHGNPLGNIRRIFTANAASLAIVGSYVSDAHEIGSDTQAIEAWSTPGPIKIDNNYLEAAGENVMFGGTGPVVAIPSDITITHNTFSKQLAWKGGQWFVKNLLELKDAQRVLVAGNTFQNSWSSAQTGEAIILNGVDGPASVIENVTIANNIITACEQGILISANAEHPQLRPTNNVLIQNNLLYGLTSFPFGIYPYDSQITIDHNTVDTAGSVFVNSDTYGPISGFVATNNISQFGVYGIVDLIGNTFVSPVVTKNVLAAADPYYIQQYSGPFPGNSFPPQYSSIGFTNLASADYSLSSASPYKGTGTNGTDPGVDMAGLRSMTSSFLSGTNGSQNVGLTISVNSPTSSNTYATSSSTVNVGGTATGSVVQVVWSSDRGFSGVANGSSAWTANGIELQSGSNLITVTARDSGGNQSSKSLTVIVGQAETTPPTISITSPTSGSNFTTSSSTINLAGTASDNIGVTQVTWVTDHGASGTAAGTTTWTINGLVLPSGSTGITVTAHDAAGNVASTILNVTYTAPDTTPPTISITSPTSGSTFTAPSNSISLSGAASDNVGVTQVAWITDRGGSGIAAGTTSWVVSGIPLPTGTTHVTVTARDGAGNVASAVLTISYTAPDTTPPSISITSPTSGPTFTTSSGTINLSGTASDDSGVIQVTWMTDHGASGIAAGTTGWTINGLVLPPGSTRVTVTAGDAAGNAASAVLAVTYTASDTAAPTISIVSPTAAGTYTAASNTVALAGTASDNVGVTQVTWVTDRGASGTAAGTTSWAINSVALQSGQNRISVTARDAAGNQATAGLVVTYTATNTGSILITSPTTDATYHALQNTVTLGGTAPSDTAQVTWVSDQGLQGQAAGTMAWTVSGIPLQKGSNRITVTARNAAGNQSSAQITVMVSHPAIVTTSLPAGKAGKLYSYQLSAVDGIPPFTWSAGSVPDGIQVSGAGTVTGTPVTTGTFSMNVAVRDSVDAESTATVKLQVDTWLALVSGASLVPGPVAPESMVTAFGWQLAAGSDSATTSPLPTQIGDCTVTIRDANGVERSASLYYVSPSQINFTIPADTAVGPAIATVHSGSQVLATGALYVVPMAPALFFMNQDGLAAAGLVRVQGDTTTYEPVVQKDDTTNQFVAVPIDLGSDTDQVYLTLYGTGLRHRSSLDSVHVYIGDVLAAVTYAGPAETFDGLDIVNVLLPQELRGKGTVDVLLTVNGAAANVVRVLIK